MSTDVVPCSTCERPGRRYQNSKACEDHTPARLAGHPEVPEPTCNAPLSCYRPCCLKRVEPPPTVKRQELDHRIEEWRTYARGEILALASQPYPFGPGDLAALLPLKLAGEHAREWLTLLLDEGEKAGAIVRVGDHEWKGARG